MTDDLFGGAIPDRHPNADRLGSDARKTLRQKDMIADGTHPATRAPLANNSHTCGDCAHLWRKRAGAFEGYKCGQATARGNDGPDARLWWPACILWEGLPHE